MTDISINLAAAFKENDKQRQRVQKSINTLRKRLKKLQKTELKITKKLKVYKKKLEEMEDVPNNIVDQELEQQKNILEVLGELK